MTFPRMCVRRVRARGFSGNGGLRLPRRGAEPLSRHAVVVEVGMAKGKEEMTGSVGGSTSVGDEATAGFPPSVATSPAGEPRATYADAPATSTGGFGDGSRDSAASTTQRMAQAGEALGRATD